jgi:pantothenate kinase
VKFRAEIREEKRKKSVSIGLKSNVKIIKTSQSRVLRSWLQKSPEEKCRETVPLEAYLLSEVLFFGTKFPSSHQFPA